MDDRSSIINLGGQEYELLLTTKATKEIAKKYGGLENLGEELIQAENFELALNEITGLIVLLANQPILIHNFRNPEDKKELLTEEFVELMTTPYDLAQYKDAIMNAMVKGTKRNVVSEDDGKNTTAG